jgi:hypothetical protein
VSVGLVLAPLPKWMTVGLEMGRSASSAAMLLSPVPLKREK